MLHRLCRNLDLCGWLEVQLKDIIQIGKRVRNVIWVTFGQQGLLYFKWKWFADCLDELPEEFAIPGTHSICHVLEGLWWVHKETFDRSWSEYFGWTSVMDRFALVGFALLQFHGCLREQGWALGWDAPIASHQCTATNKFQWCLFFMSANITV